MAKLRQKLQISHFDVIRAPRYKKELAWRTIKSILPPEDISGASFIEERIEKLTFAKRKFWLKCVCINQNGNKKQLLER